MLSGAGLSVSLQVIGKVLTLTRMQCVLGRHGHPVLAVFCVSMLQLRRLLCPQEFSGSRGYLDRALSQGLCDLAEKLGRSPAHASPCMNPAHLKSTAHYSTSSIAKDAVTCSKQAAQEVKGAHCPVEIVKRVVELTGYGRQHCHQVWFSCSQIACRFGCL